MVFAFWSLKLDTHSNEGKTAQYWGSLGAGQAVARVPTGQTEVRGLRVRPYQGRGGTRQEEG